MWMMKGMMEAGGLFTLARFATVMRLVKTQTLGLSTGSSDSAGLGLGPGVCVSTCPQVMLLPRDTL